jgi:C_GCAxxG_C_C family probable redox protein
MSEKTERAKQLHEQGYGCAQAVLTTFAPDYGIPEEIALKISTGFGSGMGRMCEMCGSLTGAYMVIGLQYGKSHTDGTRYGVNTETTYRLVSEIAKRFSERNGSTCCRDLIEHDLNDAEQRAEVVKLGYFKTRCGKYILDAVELLEEILEKYDSQNEITPPQLEKGC